MLESVRSYYNSNASKAQLVDCIPRITSQGRAGLSSPSRLLHLRSGHGLVNNPLEFMETYKAPTDALNLTPSVYQLIKADIRGKRCKCLGREICLSSILSLLRPPAGRTPSRQAL